MVIAFVEDVCIYVCMYVGMCVSILRLAKKTHVASRGSKLW